MIMKIMTSVCGILNAFFFFLVSSFASPIGWFLLLFWIARGSFGRRPRTSPVRCARSGCSLDRERGTCRFVRGLV